MLASESEMPSRHAWVAFVTPTVVNEVFRSDAVRVSVVPHDLKMAQFPPDCAQTAGTGQRPIKRASRHASSFLIAISYSPLSKPIKSFVRLTSASTTEDVTRTA